MVEVLVEFDYIAQKPDELTIKKGDIIKDVTQKPGGWWEGTLHDKKGVFPDNFVKLLEKDAVILRNKKDSSRIRQCRVVFSYNQDHEDELNLKVGDIINIIGEEEEGWWRGILNGKEGVFPSNFVEEIMPVQNRPKPSIRDDLLRLSEPVPALPAKPVKQQCEVRYSYKAQNDDELTLKEGDIITIISKDCQDPGWWKGELNGKIGVFPDNFVALLPLSAADDKKTSTSIKADNKLSAEPSAIKPSSVASQRKSVEAKNALSKPPDTKTTPPLPGKKPIISIKKSPSGSGSGLFSKLKDKIADAVDGATGSKPKTDPVAVETPSSNLHGFDQVERNPVLSDVRANRARAPGRRLPTAIHKDDEYEDHGLPNGTVAYTKSEPSVKSEDSFKSEESVSSENLDISSDLDASDTKPKLREWEKHKAPWLEEMKMNQAKRTSVSPSPEIKPKTHPPADPKPEPPEVSSKSSQNSPAEKEVNILDMSKSMSDIKVSPMEATRPTPKTLKTSPNEPDKAPPIKSKPVVPSLSSVNRHIIGSNPPSKESPSRTTVTPLQPTKISPKPKPEQYENVTIQKTIGGVTATFSTFSSSQISQSTSVTTTADSMATKTDKIEGVVSLTNFNEVLERLARLESKCERQGQMIDDLRNRLQVETEMRMILQEKIMHNNVQV